MRRSCSSSTDRCQVYKARCADFDDGKASLLGDYLPTKLGFDEGESVAAVCLPGDYSGSMLFLFANGKVGARGAFRLSDQVQPPQADRRLQ